MAFVLTDIEIVAAVGVILTAVYFVGSYWKHKTLTRYAHWFENKFSSRAKVQFASYGHAGLRVKCEMKDKSDGFRELYFAVSLGARENLMYYPLVGIMKDFDRVNCWGIVESSIGSNLVVVKSDDKKRIMYTEERANFRKLDQRDLADSRYLAYASNSDYTRKFFSHAALTSKLVEFKEIELIELDATSSMIRVVSKLREERLPKLTDFILSLGRAA